LRAIKDQFPIKITKALEKSLLKFICSFLNIYNCCNKTFVCFKENNESKKMVHLLLLFRYDVIRAIQMISNTFLALPLPNVTFFIVSKTCTFWNVIWLRKCRMKPKLRDFIKVCFFLKSKPKTVTLMVELPPPRVFTVSFTDLDCC
jgi:hypothetical protein